MLVHLGHGRLEVGVGRGVSPFELGYMKIDHEESRDIFIDAFACLCEGLAHDKLTYAGKYFSYRDAPMALRPLQQPHPPFWYGSSNTIGATWAGEHGMHFVANGGTDFAKGNIAAFRAALARRGGPEMPLATFDGAAIGILRHIVVADTDADAHRIAKPAFDYHLASLNWLRKMHGSTEFSSRLNVQRGQSFEECVENGMAIAGSPDTVRAAIERQAATLGVNYLLAYLFFGTMAFADAERSLRLFTREVMPK